MLSTEQNRLVTETKPGTPAGELLRRYWQPAALVEELQGERPVMPVRLLGEELVLFRDDAGVYGLIGRHCAHRGADLCYGRLEDGGLRCPFHGWLFDVAGRCLEQPAEPVTSNFHRKVRHPGYPVREASGILFAYLGPGEPPPLPTFDCFRAPGSHTFAFKGHIDANWLQSLEVGIDPAHAAYLHRYFEDAEADEAYGLQFRDRVDNTEIPLTQLMRQFPNPQIEVETTGYGLRIFALRDLDDTRRHVRVTNLAFPQAIVIPLSTDMTLTQWHVPIDDRQSWWYAIFTAFSAPVDQAQMRADRVKLIETPGYRPRRNRTNHWGYDAAEQRARTYTGMGEDINVHDAWAVESPGPIADRTREHLGTTDRAIIANRKLLFAALDAVGKGEPPMALADPANPLAIDTVVPLDGWDAAWRAAEARRRAASPWASRQ
ncbi:MAG: Rieske 2Fe-2S domain-containing protein [Alphaproteobacteria bacterium]